MKGMLSRQSAQGTDGPGYRKELKRGLSLPSAASSGREELRPTPRLCAVIRLSHVTDSSGGVSHAASRMLRSKKPRPAVIYV